MNRNNNAKKRNIWHLVLGIIFLGYGIFRIITLYEIENTGLAKVLAIGFIAFGIYDLWKYYKGT